MGEGAKIKVVIADDEALVRSALRLILEGDPELVILGEAADGQGAFDAARRLRPDVVLLDLHMPGRDGVWACQRIVAELPEVRVLVLTAFDTDQLVARALRAGAAGFLLKDSAFETILGAVRGVARGQRRFSAAVLEQLVAVTATAAPAASAPENLTAREIEVAVLVAEGLANTEIAERLGIGAATVKTHVSALLEKFQVRNRVQLAVAVANCGLEDERYTCR